MLSFADEARRLIFVRLLLLLWLAGQLADTTLVLEVEQSAATTAAPPKRGLPQTWTSSSTTSAPPNQGPSAPVPHPTPSPVNQHNDTLPRSPAPQRQDSVSARSTPSSVASVSSTSSSFNPSSLASSQTSSVTHFPSLAPNPSAVTPETRFEGLSTTPRRDAISSTRLAPPQGSRLAGAFQQMRRKNDLTLSENAPGPPQRPGAGIAPSNPEAKVPFKFNGAATSFKPGAQSHVLAQPAPVSSSSSDLADFLMERGKNRAAANPNREPFTPFASRFPSSSATPSVLPSTPLSNSRTDLAGFLTSRRDKRAVANPNPGPFTPFASTLPSLSGTPSTLPSTPSPERDSQASTNSSISNFSLKDVDPSLPRDVPQIGIRRPQAAPDRRAEILESTGATNSDLIDQLWRMADVKFRGPREEFLTQYAKEDPGRRVAQATRSAWL